MTKFSCREREREREREGGDKLSRKEKKQTLVHPKIGYLNFIRNYVLKENLFFLRKCTNAQFM